MDAKTAYEIAIKSDYELKTILFEIMEKSKQGRFSCYFTIEDAKTIKKLQEIGYEIMASRSNGKTIHTIGWGHFKT